MAQPSQPITKRDRFIRSVEFFRCALPAVGFILSAVVVIFLIRPHLPQVWSAGDWTLFVLGWTPLIGAGVVSVLYVPAMSLFCDHCGKHLSSKEPWLCGYCKRDNWASSFLLWCRTCACAPLAIRCPWCHKLIFLGKERDGTNFARCLKEERPQSDLSSIVRQIEGPAASLRLMTAAEGTKLQMLLFREPAGGACELRWFAKPEVLEPPTVEGYQANKHLFRQSGWEGAHRLALPPGEHLLRLLYVPYGATTKVEDVACRIVIPLPEKPENAPPEDPIAAAIAELEQLTLTPLALDEWTIRKESELREKWSKELPLEEVNGLAARFRGSTRIARSQMQK